MRYKNLNSSAKTFVLVSVMSDYQEVNNDGHDCHQLNPKRDQLLVGH